MLMFAGFSGRTCIPTLFSLASTLHLQPRLKTEKWGSSITTKKTNVFICVFVQHHIFHLFFAFFLFQAFSKPSCSNAQHNSDNTAFCYSILKQNKIRTPLFFPGRLQVGWRRVHCLAFFYGFVFALYNSRIS